jgi:hypothetical protein
MVIPPQFARYIQYFNLACGIHIPIYTALFHQNLPVVSLFDLSHIADMNPPGAMVPNPRRVNISVARELADGGISEDIQLDVLHVVSSIVNLGQTVL